MQNLSDQDIDQLFRQAADQNQPEFEPADWKRMARKLDRSSWRLRFGKWWGPTATVAVLVTAGWFTVTYFASYSERTSSLSSVSPEQLQPALDSSSSDQLNETIGFGATKIEEEKEKPHAGLPPDPTHKSNTPSLLQAQAETEMSDERSVAHEDMEITSDKKIDKGARTASRNVALSTPYTGPRINGSEVPAVVFMGTPLQRRSEVTSNDVQSTASVNIGNAERRDLVKRKEESKVSADSTGQVGEENNGETRPLRMAGSRHDTKVQADSIAVKKEVIAGDDHHGNEEHDDSTKDHSSYARVTVKLKGAPDYSSENFKSSGKTGFNYGIEVEYFATENLSISAGLIRSRKYYAMHDATYFNFVDLDIDGDCQMWDIPLNVNFYYAPAKNYSFFISGGFSSYLMSEENYSFQVTTPGYSGDETQTYSQQVRGENQEWFKMVNVSLGVQRKINRNFTLQLEPFVKIPLAEVGSANIALSSFGTYLSLRYNLLFNQK